jgi:uncharacterized protein YjbI with pentapeptide repeats
MADYSKEEVVEKSSRGESLERADLRDLSLNHVNLKSANLRRADLEGVNLEQTDLQNAILANANLRDAYLSNANLEGANLQKADLEGAKLNGANLQNADLSRANLEGASLEGARLSGACLNFAQLDFAKLGGAIMDGVQLANADLREAYLGAAILLKADLRNAHLENANLEEADLTEADLRSSNLKGAKLSGVKMTGAKLHGFEVDVNQLSLVIAAWVDFSEFANGEAKYTGTSLVDQYEQMRHGGVSIVPAAVPAVEPGKRFFGHGDVLRNAVFEFGEKSLVEIESRFENCSISLGAGATLKLGKRGVLEGCQVIGYGEIVIHGEFKENGKLPGFVGTKRLIVSKDGTVSGTLQQPPELTEFGFEQGCRLRLKIQK